MPPDLLVWFDIDGGAVVLDSRAFNLRFERVDGG
jgi:hypothetical protein